MDKVKDLLHNSNKEILIATVETGSFVEKFDLKNGYKIVDHYDDESVIIMNKREV